MIIHNPILTGSFTVNGTDVSSITSSAASITAINSYTASQNILNGTYATTGSNTFRAPQTINSNLTVTGSITASTLVVQTVSSSVIYSSGSNVFGNNIANTQTFTGSVSVSGSGAFIGIVGVGGATEAGWSLKSNGNLKVENSNGTTVLQVNDTSTGGKAWSLISAGAGNAHSVAAGTFYLRNSSDSSTAFTIASTGAATFSSSVTAQNDGAFYRLKRTSGTDLGYITDSTTWGDSGTDFAIGASSANLRFYTNNSVAERMRITSGGNVGIGVTPAAWASPTVGKVIQIGNVASLFSYNNLTNDLGCNIYFNGADYLYLQTAAASLYRQQSGEHTWFTVGSGTAGTSAGITERMRITSDGRVIAPFGYQSFKGSVSIAASATATIYTMAQASAADGVYYVYCRLNGGAAIYMASAIVTALAANSELFISNTRTGANVGLSVSGRDIRITNAGFGTFTWQWSILFQPVD